MGRRQYTLGCGNALFFWFDDWLEPTLSDYGTRMFGLRCLARVADATNEAGWKIRRHRGCVLCALEAKIRVVFYFFSWNYGG